MSWEIRVNKVLQKESMGWEVGKRFYGTTEDGKDFAIVTSQVLWYAVRIIVEDHIVERHEFLLWERAVGFCQRRYNSMKRSS